jgi:hypothetical protein
MTGLSERLRLEGLSDRVKIVHGDFIDCRYTQSFHAVFTSGAVQYSRNMKYSFEQIIKKLKEPVRDRGYIYVDYMLPLEEKYKGRDNYPPKAVWSSFFSGRGWRLLYNRVLPPLFERAHVDNPADHYHHWGHLLAQRTK